MSDEGALTFARYAYPPNELGYCGPAARTRCSCPVRWPRSNDGPGSSTAPGSISSSSPACSAPTTRCRRRWSRPTGSAATCSTRSTRGPRRAPTAAFGARSAGRGGVSGPGRAHHSYQVFEVTLGRDAAARPAVRPGGVRARPVPGPRRRRARGRRGVGARAVQPPGVGTACTLTPSSPQVERARWSVDGRSLLALPAVGDTVALHWDWVCDVLTPEQADRLQRLEGEQRAGVGLGAMPGLRRRLLPARRVPAVCLRERRRGVAVWSLSPR